MIEADTISKKSLGAKGEFRTGWPVLIACTLGTALGFPVLAVYSLGLFAPELASAFHWSFSQITAAVFMVTVALFIAGPITGGLCDRFGVRRIALISAALFGLSFMSFSLSTGRLSQYYATWLIMSLFGAGSAQAIWTRAINQHFDARRGLALGIALSGVGFFSIIGKPLAAVLISNLGWRWAYVAIGSFPLLVLVPVGLWGLEPDQQNKRLALERPAANSSGLTLAQAVRTRHFWILGVAFLPMNFGISAPLPHLENILLHQFSKSTIASITPWMGVTIILGRAIGGWLADLIWAPLLVGVLLTTSAIGCIILAQPIINYSTAVSSVLLLGAGLGVEIDLTAYMTARYLGVKHYGLLYGILYTSIALGAGGGSAVFGWAYDQTKSYSGVLTVAAAGLILSGMLLLGLGRYPTFQQPTDK